MSVRKPRAAECADPLQETPTTETTVPTLTNKDVQAVVQGLPNMRLSQADRMRALIHDNRLADVLELGVCHGVSTCYIAAALEAQGKGSITSIDVPSARDNQPNALELLERCGLSHRATVHYEPGGYLWKLMEMLEEDPTPRFDLCYLDGAHEWAIDGFAFFLVDRLLRPGGWIVFDDLDWTIDGSKTVRDHPHHASKPLAERQAPQVRKVFDLLVRTHPSYDNLSVGGQWGYARKRPDAELANAPQAVFEARNGKPIGKRLVKRLKRIVGVS